MRQIVLDTETTGIGPELGHRVIEIGCVELIDRQITNNHYHIYLNPEREIDEGALKVHGISNEFLQDKALFKEIIKPFIEFIDGAELIIHNAPFDVGFLNSELKLARWPKTLNDHCTVFDTLSFARKQHPGQRNSLDALCKRYDIDNSNRQLHGALLDAQILAYLYLAMTGGQKSLFTMESEDNSQIKTVSTSTAQNQLIDLPVILAKDHELETHKRFVEKLRQSSGQDYWSKDF